LPVAEKRKTKGVKNMKSTRNVLQESIGITEYERLLNNADQISIFGEPVKELSREELLAALSFTIQSNQEQVEHHAKENNFRPLTANTRKAGLW
jgi:ribosomal protein L16 Arg81 hydroxylase